MKLTKAQKNEVFGAVKAGGLDPFDCDLDMDGDSVAVIHPASKSLAELLEPEPGWYAVRGHVGIDPPLLWAIRVKWDGLLQGIDNWAVHVVRDVVTPDLWEEVRRAREILSQSQTGDNSAFTPEEQVQISTRIGQIKEYIGTTYELTSGQMARVEERLDAAEEASKRIGRKDWLMAFNGAVFSLFLSDLIPQQAATHMVVMAISGLGHLFGIGNLPPSLPPS